MGEGPELAVRVEHCARLADDALRAYRALVADAADWLRLAEQLGVTYVIEDAQRVLAGVEDFGPVLETVRAGLEGVIAQVGALAEGSPMAVAAGVWWPLGHRPGVALGQRYAPGIHEWDSPRGRFTPKERDIAEFLLAREPFLDIRPWADDRGESRKRNPDSIIRRHERDPGTVVEFKTLDRPSMNAVKDALKRSARQAGPVGRSVIDGRAVGLTRDVVDRAYRRYLGEVRSHGMRPPIPTTVILEDGSVLDFPE